MEKRGKSEAKKEGKDSKSPKLPPVKSKGKLEDLGKTKGGAPVKYNPEADKKLAHNLFEKYGHKQTDALEEQQVVDMILDAYKLANKKIKIGKAEIKTLMKLLDKDGDGKVSLADLEEAVGVIMVKKHKEDLEREDRLEKMKDESKRLVSPIRAAKKAKEEASVDKKSKGKSSDPQRAGLGADKSPKSSSKAEGSKNSLNERSARSTDGKKEKSKSDKTEKEKDKSKEDKEKKKSKK